MLLDDTHRSVATSRRVGVVLTLCLFFCGSIFAQQSPTVDTSAPATTPSDPAQSSASFRHLPKDLLTDQFSFWTSPRKFRSRDFSWFAPLALATTVTIASDLRIERALPSSTSLISRS